MVLSHQSHSFWSAIISCTVHTTPHRSACPGCREQFRVLLSDVEHCAFYAQSSELRVLMLSMSVEILPRHSGQAGPTHPSPPVIHYPSHHSFRLITKEYKDKVIVLCIGQFSSEINIYLSFRCLGQAESRSALPGTRALDSVCKINWDARPGAGGGGIDPGPGQCRWVECDIAVIGIQAGVTTGAWQPQYLYLIYRVFKLKEYRSKSTPMIKCRMSDS